MHEKREPRVRITPTCPLGDLTSARRVLRGQCMHECVSEARGTGDAPPDGRPSPAAAGSSAGLESRVCSAAAPWAVTHPPARCPFSI